MILNDDPLVSIIVPFLNEEKFLADALDSVLEQDYSHWELLLIDDGSTDNSTFLAKNYAKKHSQKIKYYDHQNHVNKGLSPSRNLGIKKSQGEWIALLDADDVWLSDKLSTQISIIKRFPEVSMILEGSDYWYNWEDPDLKNKHIPIGAPQNRIYHPPELLYELYPLNKGAAPCPSGIMINKDACIHSGGFEESFINEYSLYEDQAFLHKFYLNEKIYVSDTSNNLYRQHSDSIVSSVHASGKYRSVRLYFLEWLLKYAKTNKTSLTKKENREVISLIRKTTLAYKYPYFYRNFYHFPSKVFQRFLNYFR